MELYRDKKDKYKYEFNHNYMKNKHINTIKLIMYNKIIYLCNYIIMYFSYIVTKLHFTLHYIQWMLLSCET